MSTEHVQKFGGIVLPIMILTLALLFNVTSLPMTASFKAVIPFVLIVGFYWSIYRPDAVPLWAMFVCGLMLDFLSGLPLGLNAFSLMAVCWVTRDQRVVLITQPFMMLWFVFSLFCVVEALIKWAVFGLMSMQWSVVAALIPDVAFGVLVYPFIALLLHALGKLFFDGDIYRGDIND